MEVFPNPTSGFLTIKGSGLKDNKYQILLFNAMGQEMDRKDFLVVNNDLEANLFIEHLPDGPYMLIIKSLKTHYVFKVLKQ